LEPEIAAAEFDVPEPMPVSSARFREQAEDTSCSISSGVESRLFRRRYCQGRATGLIEVKISQFTCKACRTSGNPECGGRQTNVRIGSHEYSSRSGTGEVLTRVAGAYEKTWAESATCDLGCARGEHPLEGLATMAEKA
jgi:hypothetical protein